MQPQMLGTWYDTMTGTRLLTPVLKYKGGQGTEIMRVDGIILGEEKHIGWRMVNDIQIVPYTYTWKAYLIAGDFVAVI